MFYGVTDEEQVTLMMELLGVTESRARFIISLERGEIHGDVIDVYEEEIKN